MKKCPHCMMDIPWGGDICPYCRQRPYPDRPLTPLGTLALLGLIIGTWMLLKWMTIGFGGK